ncbi:MAG: hypothetical protein IJZ37_01345, partial [Clostridia bacterium]|nr:hypothetical protein [Clostridia bacterium]
IRLRTMELLCNSEKSFLEIFKNFGCAKLPFGCAKLLFGWEGFGVITHFAAKVFLPPSEIFGSPETFL